MLSDSDVCSSMLGWLSFSELGVIFYNIRCSVWICLFFFCILRYDWFIWVTTSSYSTGGGRRSIRHYLILLTLYSGATWWWNVRPPDTMVTWTDCVSVDLSLLLYFNFTMTFKAVCSVIFKVAVHTCDVLWCENLIKTLRHTSLTTSCIVTLFNLIEVWSIAMHGQLMVS